MWRDHPHSYVPWLHLGNETLLVACRVELLKPRHCPNFDQLVHEALCTGGRRDKAGREIRAYFIHMLLSLSTGDQKSFVEGYRQASDSLATHLFSLFVDK